MNRFLELVILAVASLIVALGVNLAVNGGVDFTQLFFGNPADKSIWVLRGGILSIAVGFVMSLNPARH